MENEAINKLKAYLECQKKKVAGIYAPCNDKLCDNCELCYTQGNAGEHIACIETAIKALEEVQQYRKIGTPEEGLQNKDFLDFLADKMNPNDFETYFRMYNAQEEKGR